MLNPEEPKEYPEKQKQILKLLLSKSYRQKELAVELGISGAGLLYHLNLLEKDKLIFKKKLFEVGNVTINEISLNPNMVQLARTIVKMPIGKCTLITGFGKDSDLGPSSMIPATVKGLLEKENYTIDRIIAFVGTDSNVENANRFVKIDEYISRDYNDYRNEHSELMQNIESIVRNEQVNSEVILDLTPLSKLLTIKLLEISYRYQIPSFYLGKTKDDKDYLLWIVR